MVIDLKSWKERRNTQERERELLDFQAPLPPLDCGGLVPMSWTREEDVTDPDLMEQFYMKDTMARSQVLLNAARAYVPTFEKTCDDPAASGFGIYFQEYVLQACWHHHTKEDWERVAKMLECVAKEIRELADWDRFVSGEEQDTWEWHDKATRTARKKGSMGFEGGD